jgi:hypothetical protein
MTKFIIIVAVGILISIVFIELAVGCGQVTYFPDRTWRSNECVFISSEISYGRW